MFVYLLGPCLEDKPVQPDPQDITAGTQSSSAEEILAPALFVIVAAATANLRWTSR